MYSVCLGGLVFVTVAPVCSAKCQHGNTYLSIMYIDKPTDLVVASTETSITQTLRRYNIYKRQGLLIHIYNNVHVNNVIGQHAVCSGTFLTFSLGKYDLNTIVQNVICIQPIAVRVFTQQPAVFKLHVISTERFLYLYQATYVYSCPPDFNKNDCVLTLRTSQSKTPLYSVHFAFSRSLATMDLSIVQLTHLIPWSLIVSQHFHHLCVYSIQYYSDYLYTLSTYLNNSMGTTETVSENHFWERSN